MPKRARRKPQPSDFDIEQLFEAPTTAKEKDIIEAAIALIGQRGIDGATTAEIARHANVTEKTLFRYFPSKQDLVRRVLFPLLMRGGITEQWTALETMLKTKTPDLKKWYVAAATERYQQVSKNPSRTRTVLLELLQNTELRSAMAVLWQKHIWLPMLEHLKEMQATNQLRQEVDIEVLARMIHYMQVGYFLARHVFAPDSKWDTAGEFSQIGDILTIGATRRSAK